MFGQLGTKENPPMNASISGAHAHIIGPVVLTVQPVDFHL